MSWLDTVAYRMAGKHLHTALNCDCDAATGISDPSRNWRERAEELVSRPSPGGDSHYKQGGIEPADFILTNNLPHWKGVVIEYIFRAGHKINEREDIKKAIWWLQKRLEQLK